MSSNKPREVSPSPPEGYADWLAQLTTRVVAAQQRAVLVANAELLALYWQIGPVILDVRESARIGLRHAIC